MATTRMTFLRPFTTHLFNPISRRFADRLPGFAILSYVGRNIYIFALTYGSEVNWVKNVLAAGECDMRTRGRDVHLVEPELFTDPTRHLMPLVVRVVLRLNDVQEFLQMRPA